MSIAKEVVLIIFKKYLLTKNTTLNLKMTCIELRLLLIDSKIGVPSSLKNDILLLVHDRYFGIGKSKNRVREIMFWPGMYKIIVKIVSWCEVRQKFQRA